jgi:uncharacterized protein (TIGR03067 family)
MKFNSHCSLALLLSLTAVHFGCKPANTRVSPAPDTAQSTTAATPTVAPETPTPSESTTATPALKTDGVWKVKSAIIAGQPLPPEAANAITLTLTNEQYVVDLGGAIDKGTFTTDLGTTPNRMTIKGTEGPNTGKTMLTIFDAPDAQTMRLCYDLEGKEFPQAFESTAENKYFFVNYVRQ